jgi:hypothetical protein
VPKYRASIYFAIEEKFPDSHATRSDAMLAQSPNLPVRLFLSAPERVRLGLVGIESLFHCHLDLCGNAALSAARVDG